jgi:hypothetical protein
LSFFAIDRFSFLGVESVNAFSLLQTECQSRHVGGVSRCGSATVRAFSVVRNLGGDDDHGREIALNEIVAAVKNALNTRAAELAATA